MGRQPSAEEDAFWQQLTWWVGIRVNERSVAYRVILTDASRAAREAASAQVNRRLAPARSANFLDTVLRARIISSDERTVNVKLKIVACCTSQIAYAGALGSVETAGGV